MELEYDKLRDIYVRIGFEKADKIVIDMFKCLEDVIEPCEIELFYPKNIFVSDKRNEFYIFSHKKVIIVRELSDDKNELEIFNLKDKLGFIYERSNSCSVDNRLKLKLCDGRELLFDSVGDANSGWKSMYSDRIKQIANYLIKEV